MEPTYPNLQNRDDKFPEDATARPKQRIQPASPNEPPFKRKRTGPLLRTRIGFNCGSREEDTVNSYEERAKRELDRNANKSKSVVDWRGTKIRATEGARDSDPWQMLGLRFHGCDIETEMQRFGTMPGNLNLPREARNKRSYALDSAEENTLAKIAGLRYYFSTLAPNECVRPAVADVAKRIITPTIEKCVRCRKSKAEHRPDSHIFELDQSLRWKGWHAFRRGLATTLHQLGTPDREIQAILRHSNIAITQKSYIKSIVESQVNALDRVAAEMANESNCNQTATKPQTLVN